MSRHGSTRTSPTTISYAATPTTSVSMNAASAREYPLSAVSNHRSSRYKPTSPVPKLTTTAIPIPITPGEYSRQRDPIPSASIGRHQVIA
ncbi:unnamed protein product [Ambrosiozyma monospora]|uniref:Unnamed protein product n=1 Tax=Ambrosiozyma monospora TaxID=43982 RepID=A0ACB5SS18_AMBMO|nr:unnamed protein product [Ambrosiozyma monospora]